MGAGASARRIVGEQVLARLPGPVARTVRGQAAAQRLRRAAARANRRGPVVSGIIHPDDEMFDHRNPDHYFEVGRSALAAIEVGLAEAGSVAEVRRILDVPCGHGRVLRMLRGRWPNAELTACDLNRDAVDFCVDTFVASGVYSTNPISDVDGGEDHDLVWVGSLLTHLDAPRWSEMLEWMRDRLRPGGVLIASTHGAAGLAKMSAGADYGLTAVDRDRVVGTHQTTGFGYAPYPWDPDYGISLSSPTWVRSTIAAISGLDLVSLHERAWDDHHDVVTLRRV